MKSSVTSKFLAYRSSGAKRKPEPGLPSKEKPQAAFIGWLSNAETKEERLERLFELSLTHTLHENDLIYLHLRGRDHITRMGERRDSIKTKAFRTDRLQGQILAETQAVIGGV